MAPPIAKYQDLLDAIGNLLLRNDLREHFPLWVSLVEAELARDARPRPTELTKAMTITAGLDQIDVPADLLEPRFLRIDTDPVRHVEIRTLDWLANIRSSSPGDFPIAAALHGDALLLAPTPNVTSPCTLFYVGDGLFPLGPDNPTNGLLRRAPDALLYGAAWHSAPFLGEDERIPVWRNFYDAAKQSYQRLEWRAKFGMGPARARPDFQIADGHRRTP